MRPSLRWRDERAAGTWCCQPNLHKNTSQRGHMAMTSFISASWRRESERLDIKKYTGNMCADSAGIFLQIAILQTFVQGCLSRPCGEDFCQQAHRPPASRTPAELGLNRHGTVCNHLATVGSTTTGRRPVIYPTELGKANTAKSG